MQRVTWTDERLDDLSRSVEVGFRRLDLDIRELRRELRSDVSGARSDLRTDISRTRSELGAEIAELRTLTMRFGSAIIIAMIGVIAAQLLGG
jgi:hypothetical protein